MKNLTVSDRTIIGKKVKGIRLDKAIPAVVYGPKLPSQNITLDYKEFAKVFADVGYSKLLDIDLNGGKQKVLVKEVQIHPVLRAYRHVSFYAVDMKTPITASIPLEIEGIAPAVKNNLGFLEVPANNINVKCLPGDLPSSFKIDISKLENVGDGISIADLNLGAEIEVLGLETHQRLVFIAAPQKEIVEEVPVVAAEAGEEGAAAEGDAAKEGGAEAGADKKKAE